MRKNVATELQRFIDKNPGIQFTTSELCEQFPQVAASTIKERLRQLADGRKICDQRQSKKDSIYWSKKHLEPTANTRSDRAIPNAASKQRSIRH